MAERDVLYVQAEVERGLILGRNWDKGLKNFPPCFSQSPLLTDFPPPPLPPSKRGLELVCNGKIVNGNSQDYAQKPQRNFTFMNSASDHLRVASSLTIITYCINVARQACRKC
jgi:hypothetical protein